MNKSLLRVAILTMVLITCLSTCAYAKTTEWVAYQENWLVESKQYSGGTNNGSTYKRFYIGSPAQRDGETDSCSITQEYSGSISGTLNVSISAIEASVGFSVNRAVSFTVSKTSAALKKGQHIEAAWRKYFDKYKVVQKLLRVGYAMDFDDKHQPISNRYNKTQIMKRATVYVNKPLMPQIQLTYYSSTSAKILSTTPYQRPLVETYTYINGAYQLTDRRYK